MKQNVKVAQVASWDGWCSPCEREDRPLVLTRSGPGGLRAWLAGHGDDDRCLLLTCRACGRWQVVPRHEEDDPEVVLVDEAVAEAAAVAPVELPAPRSAQPVVLREREPSAPEVCAETRAATMRVLAAARTAEQAAVMGRSAPLDRSRRRQSGPAPRRPERSSTAVRVPRPRTADTAPAATSIALPSDTVLDLLASGHQVVLAPAG